MDISCLEHRLTDEERRTFDEEGYFVIPDDVPLRTWLLEHAPDAVDITERTAV